MNRLKNPEIEIDVIMRKKRRKKLFLIEIFFKCMKSIEKIQNAFVSILKIKIVYQSQHQMIKTTKN